MENSIIIRYSEIGIKGKNRPLFEKKLVSNIKDFFKKNNFERADIIRKSGRIIINLNHYEENMKKLKYVFGISSFSPAIKANADLENIKKSTYFLIKNFQENETFRITATRITKTIGLSSAELEKEIGKFVAEKTGCRVSLKNFDNEVGIEIICNSAYVFSERVKGFGGLPLGVEGSAISFVDPGKIDDSLVASILAMKRGVSTINISTKQVSTSAIDKFCYGQKNGLVVVNDIEDVKKICEQSNTSAIILPDSIADLKNKLKTANLFFDAEKSFVFLRPLIAYDFEELKKLKIEMS